MSLGARNWPFLTLTGAPGLRRGDEQIGLPAEERGNLQDVDDLGGRRRLRRLVDVGQDRQPGALLDLGEDRAGRRRARARETRTSDVRLALSNDALKMSGTPTRVAISVSAGADLDRVRLALDDARPEDEGERMAGAE